MNYLVDTHILLWSFMEPEKLSRETTSILLDVSNDIFYSPINLWEISIKYRLKKAVEPLIIATNHNLPLRHKDPFDRFLIWEAIKSDFTLLTSDGDIAQYKDDGLKFVL